MKKIISVPFTFREKFCLFCSESPQSQPFSLNILSEKSFSFLDDNWKRLNYSLIRFVRFEKIILRVSFNHLTNSVKIFHKGFSTKADDFSSNFSSPVKSTSICLISLFPFCFEFCIKTLSKRTGNFDPFISIYYPISGLSQQTEIPVFYFPINIYLILIKE